MRARVAPNNPSSTTTRLACRWNSCSVVKPMPASTCWQWRAAVRGAAAGERLGDGRRPRGTVLPGRVEHGVRRLRRHQRLGQPVPHGLEAGDRLPELHALEGVAAGERQHRAGGAHELVADGQLGQRDRRGPRRGRHLGGEGVPGHAAGDLHEPEPRVHAVHPTQRQVARRHAEGDLGVGCLGDHDGGVAAGQRRGGEPADGEAGAVEPARRARGPERRQHEPGRVGDVQPEGAREHPVERGRGAVARALHLEEDGHRRPGVLRQRVGPPERVERRIERRAGVRLHGVAQAPLEQRALGAVHQRSLPRSSSRRAMMLRWISAVPP